MDIAVTRAADGFARRAFSVEDVRRMIGAGVIGEEERIELIGGDIVVRPPNFAVHDLIKSALTRVAVRALPRDLFLGVATTLQLADDVLVDVDMAIMRWQDFRARPSDFAQPPRQAVWLAVEIACAHLDYDRSIKARLYARHGVREFWVIDANERIAWVHTGPQGDGWASIVERGPTETLATPALPDFKIRLADID